MNEINDIKVRSPKIHKSYINIFDSKRFEEVEKHDTQANNTCVQTRLKVIDKYWYALNSFLFSSNLS